MFLDVFSYVNLAFFKWCFFGGSIEVHHWESWWLDSLWRPFFSHPLWVSRPDLVRDGLVYCWSLVEDGHMKWRLVQVFIHFAGFRASVCNLEVRFSFSFDFPHSISWFAWFSPKWTGWMRRSIGLGSPEDFCNAVRSSRSLFLTMGCWTR